MSKRDERSCHCDDCRYCRAFLISDDDSTWATGDEEVSEAFSSREDLCAGDDIHGGDYE